MPPNLLSARREGEERGKRSKKGRTNRNNDIRCGHSHRSLSVMSVECEEQEKTWMVIWGSLHKKGRGG